MICQRDGVSVKLTRKLWMILMVLRNEQGRVVPRIDLNAVLGVGERSRSPDTLLAALRKLLGHNVILTVHGFGWKAGPDLLHSVISDSCGNQPEYEI